LVNFELNVGAINLFLGANGSGKSTVFEVLQKIQEFVGGDSTEKIFKPTDFTRWQTLTTQRFELEILGNGGCYKYELGIGYDRDKCYIEYERLWFDNQPLIKIELGEVQIYQDNHDRTIQFSLNENLLRSMLSILGANENDDTKLAWFQKRMTRFIIVKIIPSLMIDESDQEAIRLTSKIENFVSWYRHISEDQGKVIELVNILRQVLAGFITFNFERVTEKSRVLKLKFTGDLDGKKLIEYRFSELSDGQKTLVALYALIYGTKSEDYTLCIDEPENFLALPEIQPWLIQLYDLCSDGELQSLLISHHPELINYLLASPIGYWFERQSNAPVRVKRISSQVADDSGLPISELIARGWLNEPA
jgi:predicted ATPase